MTSRLITPIILAHEEGNALWPVSNQQYPSQFCKIGGGFSSFQHSLLQVKNSFIFTPATVICGHQHVDLVTTQARQLGIALSLITMDPDTTDSATAIATGVEASASASDQLFVVLSSTNEIRNITPFQQMVAESTPVAAENFRIVFFGKEPEHVEADSHFIRTGSQIGDSPCRRFVEYHRNPEHSEVEQYIQQKELVCDSKIMLFRKDVIRAELERHSSGICEQVSRTIAGAVRCGNKLCVYEDTLPEFPDTWFGQTLLEKANCLAVARLSSQVIDHTSWKNYWESKNRDSDENVLEGNVLDADSERCMVYSDGPLVATCGLEDIVVIADGNSVLVVPRSNMQGVENMVTALKELNHPCMRTQKPILPTSTKSIQKQKPANKTRIRQFEIEAGEQMATSFHFNNARHIFVSYGEVELTAGNKKFVLKEGEQSEIPQGILHRLENRSDDIVEIIEVEQGAHIPSNTGLAININSPAANPDNCIAEKAQVA